MPRLRRTPEQRGDDHIVGIILGWIKRNNSGMKEIAEILGCSRATMYNRMENPSSFTGAEIRKLLIYGVVEMEDLEIYYGRKMSA